MPGKKVGAKQNRLAKHRKQVCEELVDKLVDPELYVDGTTFGLINKHSGNGQLAVTLPNKAEGRAVLRGLLGKCNIKNVFPAGSIVVLGVREFDKKTYDVMAVLTRKDAKQLVKQDKLPEWMLSSADGAQEGEDDGFVFEDSESEDDKKEKEEKAEDKARRESKRVQKRPELDDDELDIDNI
jgi:hypothetical protein